ncbi:MAG: hypothetical protein KKB27_03005, partial [Nanoarchaeota archaeon]|nr:hypothetical protein [Nanoarchaeota archaeon]
MESNFKLGLLDLPDNFYCKLNKPYLQKIKKVIKKNYGKEEILRREIKTLFKEDISRTTLSTFLKGSTFLSLKRLKIFQSIFDLTALEKNVISIKSSKSGLPISIKLPLKQSKTLARLIGHLLGDGGIFDYSIYYFNKNETLINQFEKDSYEVFGKFKIEKITNLDGTTRLRLPKITGKILSLEKINFSRGKIPNFILKGSREIKAAFLRAIFDDEGSITNNEISIEMTNKNLIYTTATFLKEFEIEIKTIGSRKRDVYKRSYYYGIYGKADLIKFHKQIGFNHPIKDKKLFRKIN